MGEEGEEGGDPLSATFLFQKDAEDLHSSPQLKGLSPVLNMLQTEHVNTPGEHIQML